MESYSGCNHTSDYDIGRPRKCCRNDPRSRRVEHETQIKPFIAMKVDFIREILARRSIDFPIQSLMILSPFKVRPRNSISAETVSELGLPVVLLDMSVHHICIPRGHHWPTEATVVPPRCLGWTHLFWLVIQQSDQLFDCFLFLESTRDQNVQLDNYPGTKIRHQEPYHKTHKHTLSLSLEHRSRFS